MIDLPEICATERTPRGVRLMLRVPQELSYFQGHFPQCPLLPGVVQISWSIELGRKHVPFSARFRELRAVKFTRVILPGASVTLQLDYSPEERQLHFAYRLDDQVCSSGSALFDAQADAQRP